MIKYNIELYDDLLTAGTKVDWAAKIIAALGTNRRLIAKQANNSTEVDIWTNGVEFLNAKMTGTIVHENGNLVDFGEVDAMSVRLAVNLAMGASVIRIVGDNGWIEGSFGLKGNGAVDFAISANPTVTSGVGFGVSASILAPRFLPSGSGPEAPTLTLDSPSYVEIMDWTDPLAPKLHGTILFNRRIDDLTMQDEEKALDMGDVLVMQSTDTVVFQGFEFGAMLFAMNEVVNADGNGPVYQVLVNFKPHGRWSGYPSQEGWDKETDVTHMKPFKAVVKNALGVTLGTCEMRDGLPINSPLLPQNRTTFVPTRPRLNCGMMLFWEKGTPRASFKLGKWMPGVDADTMRPSQAKLGDAVNGFHPVLTQRGQINSYAHLWAMSRWSMGTYEEDARYSNLTKAQLAAKSDADEGEVEDPFLYKVSVYSSGGNTGFQGARAIGWDYEPGSISGHDQFNGPGGHRFDRSYAPSMMIVYITDPTGRRLKGNYSYKDMNNAWRKAYFNHSCHHFTDVKNFTTIPLDQAMRYEWAHSGFYYGGTQTEYVAGGDARHIPLWSISNTPSERTQRTYTSTSVMTNWREQKTIVIPSGKIVTPGTPVRVTTAGDGEYGVVGNVDAYNPSTGELKFTVTDWMPKSRNPIDPYIQPNLVTYSNGLDVGFLRNPDGNMMWNGWAPDAMHDYTLPGWYTLLFNSPAHLVSATHRFIHSLLCQIGPSGDPQGMFLMRAQAWRIGQMVMAWKLASTHQLGIPREAIEKLLETDLLNVYNYRYLAAKDPTHPEYNSIYNKSMRALGVGIKDEKYPSTFGDKHYHECSTVSQTYYFAHVFYLLKQTGCWRAMAKRNPKCDVAMRFMLECMDKFSIDFILDTDGRIEGYYNFPGQVGDHYFPVTQLVPQGQPHIVPANWAEWDAIVAPRIGQEDWIRDEAGKIFDYSGSMYERSATQHFRAQWAFMRRDCFPEIPYPRLEEACAKYKGYYDAMAAHALTEATLSNRARKDWHYRIPSSGIIKPPTEVEPIA